MLLQKSKTWAERASKGCSFALTNMKRKDKGSAEPVTFTLNFRQALSSSLKTHETRFDRYDCNNLERSATAYTLIKLGNIYTLQMNELSVQPALVHHSRHP